MLNHDHFMNVAIKEAKKCLKYNDIPVGAIIVDKNQNIVSKGHNKVEQKNNSLMHAEKIVIDKALLKTNRKYLENYDIWVTLEPCEMCLGIIKQVRIKRLYYGASSQKLISKKIVSNNFDKKICSEIYSGIKQNECSKLLTDFFRKIRSVL